MSRGLPHISDSDENWHLLSAYFMPNPVVSALCGSASLTFTRTRLVLVTYGYCYSPYFTHEEMGQKGHKQQ